MCVVFGCLGVYVVVFGCFGVYVVSCLAVWECMLCRVWLFGSVCSAVFACLGSVCSVVFGCLGSVCSVVFGCWGVYVVSCLAVWECM